MRLMNIALLCMGLVTPVAMAADAVETSLLKDIQQAQQSLQQYQQKTDKERTHIAASLRKLESEVADLRERTAVTRRLNDENTLGLSQLQERLDSWQQQQQYQSNLLKRFLHQQQILPTSSRADLLQGLTLLNTELQSIRLHPQWQEQQLVMPDGTLQQAQVLRIGPVHWWLGEDNGGFALPEDGLLKAGPGLPADGLKHLQQSGQGELPLDPSLNHSRLVAQNSESAFEHIAKGGLWALPIIFFALFALAIALLKAVQLWRLPRVTALTRSQVYSSNESASLMSGMSVHQQELLSIARQEANPEYRDDLLFAALQRQKHQLERYLGAIAITASVSPLLGLLGTVSGMIETFKMMTLFGSGDPQVVSGGIAQALITTELGLVVAIPALILNALLSRKARAYFHELEDFAIKLSQSEQPANAAVKPAPHILKEVKA
ncbi:MotA/TolQ/ExbB proton channel family protein [Bowmanella denitrificans]|uniref:MotA/TolQ/ExbB proton channel family protein n=1 Tax=Bowmanella denitrificans TaxID=366582 RepID=A0ABP3GYR3_9ALTE